MCGNRSAWRHDEIVQCDDYRCFLRAGEHPTDAPRMCMAPLFVARQRAAAEGFTRIEGSCFAASPAGTTNRADYEYMRDEVLAQLKAALSLDGVLFGLRGASGQTASSAWNSIRIATLR